MTTMTFKLSLAALALLAAASAQASCYTVLNAKGDIVSQTSTPPVDMALRLDQTVPQRYGAGANAGSVASIGKVRIINGYLTYTGGV